MLGWTSGLQTRTGAKACVSQKLRGLGNGSDLANTRQNVLDVRKQRDGCGKKVCWKFVLNQHLREKHWGILCV